MVYERPAATGETLWTMPELPTETALEGYHVTDDPRIVLTTLRAGLPLDRGIDASPGDDLKISGLYISECWRLWMGRSAIKWKFAGGLAPKQREAIAQAIRHDERMTGNHSLSEGDKQYVTRHLERFVATGSAECLTAIAIQPYNFATWKPGFLAQFGIVNYELPAVVPVKVQGSFADVSSVNISQDLMLALKLSGHDGAFVNGSWSFTSQAVVWNNRAIAQFGDYTPGDPDR